MIAEWIPNSKYRPFSEPLQQECIPLECVPITAVIGGRPNLHTDHNPSFRCRSPSAFRCRLPPPLDADPFLLKMQTPSTLWCRPLPRLDVDLHLKEGVPPPWTWPSLVINIKPRKIPQCTLFPKAMLGRDSHCPFRVNFTNCCINPKWYLFPSKAW